MPEDDGAPREIPLEPRKRKRTSRRSRKRVNRDSSAVGGRTLPRGRLARVAFPKHSLEKCLRIPQAILDQNAGNECTDREAAVYAKVGWTGEVHVEISSAIKYGLLERPTPGKVKPTDLVRKIVRPQSANDRLDALREAVLKAPVISDLYQPVVKVRRKLNTVLKKSSDKLKLVLRGPVNR